MTRRMVGDVLMNMFAVVTWVVVSVGLVLILAFIVGFVLVHSDPTCGIAATGSNC